MTMTTFTQITSRLALATSALALSLVLFGGTVTMPSASAQVASTYVGVVA